MYFLPKGHVAPWFFMKGGCKRVSFHVFIGSEVTPILPFGCTTDFAQVLRVHIKVHVWFLVIEIDAMKAAVDLLASMCKPITNYQMASSK
jgi:hypothetical protein